MYLADLNTAHPAVQMTLENGSFVYFTFVCKPSYMNSVHDDSHLCHDFTVYRLRFIIYCFGGLGDD